MAFFNGQFRLSKSKYFSSQTTTCKIQFDIDVKAMEIKLNGRGPFPQVTWFLHSLPLIGHNLLLVYYHFEYKGNFYKYGLYYTWVQMLLQIGPLLHLGSKCYYGWDFYSAWVQMLLQMGPSLHLGPIITLVPSIRISREVSSANAWYEINGMIANPSKHQGMILGKTDHQFNFSVNDSVELFGVTIDKDLTFKQHVSSICKKVNNQFSVMTRFGKTDVYWNHAASL